jgi:hypothetical protein
MFASIPQEWRWVNHKMLLASLQEPCAIIVIACTRAAQFAVVRP